MTYDTMLPLTDDLTFKVFFKREENRPLLVSVLEAFLPLPEGSKITDVDVLDPELTPEELAKAKGRKRYVLDLRATFERTAGDGTRERESVNVEMQTGRQARMTDRMLAYAARLYGGQARGSGRGGDYYKKLGTVYSLLFTTRNLPEFGASPGYAHVCNIRETKEPYAVFSRGMCFVVVELGKFRGEAASLLDPREQWCYLLKNAERLEGGELEELAARGEHMAKAVKSLWNMSQEERMREILIAEERDRMDRRTNEVYAREEGRREGEEKGRKEGRREGEEKGRKEGRQEGREEERGRLALSMLEDGFNREVIEKHTGLSKQEIEALAKDR